MSDLERSTVDVPVSDEWVADNIGSVTAWVEAANNRLRRRTHHLSNLLTYGWTPPDRDPLPDVVLYPTVHRAEQAYREACLGLRAARVRLSDAWRIIRHGDYPDSDDW
jgi:hypothetical protein